MIESFRFVHDQNSSQSPGFSNMTIPLKFQREIESSLANLIKKIEMKTRDEQNLALQR